MCRARVLRCGFVDLFLSSLSQRPIRSFCSFLARHGLRSTARTDPLEDALLRNSRKNPIVRVSRVAVLFSKVLRVACFHAGVAVLHGARCLRDGQGRTPASRARRSTAKRRRVVHVRSCARDEAPPSGVRMSNAPLLGSNPTRDPSHAPSCSSPRPDKGGHVRSMGEIHAGWGRDRETDPTTTTNGVVDASTTPQGETTMNGSGGHGWCKPAQDRIETRPALGSRCEIGTDDVAAMHWPSSCTRCVMVVRSPASKSVSARTQSPKRREPFPWTLELVGAAALLDNSPSVSLQLACQMNR